MEVLYTDLSLDFADNRTLKTIKIKQHDDHNRVIRIAVFHKGQRITLDSNTDTAVINASVGGTVTAYHDDTGVGINSISNTVNVTLTDNLTTLAGTEHCEIMVSYTDSRINANRISHTATFDLLVEPSVANTDHQSILANTDLALNWAAELADINALDITQNTRLTTIESDISAINTLNTTQNTRLSTIESGISAINTLNTTQNARLSTIESDISAINTLNTTQNARLSTIESDISAINTLNTIQNTRLSTIESDISAINTLNTTQNTRLSDVESVNTTQNTRLTAIEGVNTTQNTSITNINNTLTTWDTAISNIVEYVTNIRFDISTELDLTTDPNNPVKPFIRISRTGTVPKDAILFCKNSYGALSGFGIAENASPAETTYIYYDKIQQYSSSATGTWAFVADTVNQCFAMRKLNVSTSSNDRLRSTDWVIFVLHLQHSTGKIYAGNKIIYSNNVYIDGELQSITDTSSVIGLKNSWFCLKSNPSNAARATMKIISATGNTHYRFLISDTQNITDFVTVCIFSDSTYTRLDTKNVSADGSGFFVDVTTSENAAYLRFNAKIGNNGTVGSLTLTQFSGDSHSIEGRVTALENREILTNKTTCKIFKKVVCCGDSYTAGYIDIREDTEVEPVEGVDRLLSSNYSWVHFMSTLTGNNWINCGVSGSNVLTWRGLYDEHYANYYSNIHPSDSTIIIGHKNNAYKDKIYSNIGYDAAAQAGQTQAYVIGLLINDSAPVGNAHHVDLGGSSDIGAEYPTTFYGGLSKIIRDLHSISPKAKIFVNTCPKNDSSARQYSLYNQAVRNVVNYYKNNYAYPVHCIDLANHSDLYSNSSLTGDYINGHYTAIGYEQFAEIYALLLSDYINTHISEFQDVAFIPITNPTTNGNGE